MLRPNHGIRGTASWMLCQDVFLLCVQTRRRDSPCSPSNAVLEPSGESAGRVPGYRVDTAATTGVPLTAAVRVLEHALVGQLLARHPHGNPEPSKSSNC